MNTRIFIPPVKRATGGVAVLCQIADYLHAAGQDVALVLREAGAWNPEGFSHLPVLPWEAPGISEDTLWLVPEGWVNALAPGLSAKARCVVYCQNWAYLFSSLPQNVDWRSLPVSFIAVSAPVRQYIVQTLGQDCPVLRPGIDTARFFPPEKKPGGPARIAFMPRKNKALADQIRDGFTAARRGQGKPDVIWTPIHGMSADQVATVLRESHVFLATGYPEGCPLPPLEALASGCLLVGFSGYGGWDYMRQAGDFPGAYRPWWPLRDVPWGGNALVCADADVPGVINGLLAAVSWWESGDVRLDAALDAAQATVRAYTVEEQRRAVLELWENFASGGRGR